MVTTAMAFGLSSVRDPRAAVGTGRPPTLGSALGCRRRAGAPCPGARRRQDSSHGAWRLSDGRPRSTAESSVRSRPACTGCSGESIPARRWAANRADPLPVHRLAAGLPAPQPRADKRQSSAFPRTLGPCTHVHALPGCWPGSSCSWPAQSSSTDGRPRLHVTRSGGICGLAAAPAPAVVRRVRPAREPVGRRAPGRRPGRRAGQAVRAALAGTVSFAGTGRRARGRGGRPRRHPHDLRAGGRPPCVAATRSAPVTGSVGCSAAGALRPGRVPALGPPRGERLPRPADAGRGAVRCGCSRSAACRTAGSTSVRPVSPAAGCLPGRGQRRGRSSSRRRTVTRRCSGGRERQARGCACW